MKFRLNETLLSYKELEDVKIKIARDIYLPAADIRLQDNGRFEISNIDETDKNRIINKLKMSDYCKQISANAGRYDFGHFTNLGQPKQKYNITGIIDLNKFKEK